MITVAEMRADSDWKHAFYEAQFGTYGPNYDWQAGVEHAPEEYALNHVAEVIRAEPGENDGASWLCVCRMDDGRFVVMSAGCDYTGWDCQAGGEIHWYASLEEATGPLGLNDDQRVRLGLASAPPAEIK